MRDLLSNDHGTVLAKKGVVRFSLGSCLVVSGSLSMLEQVDSQLSVTCWTVFSCSHSTFDKKPADCIPDDDAGWCSTIFAIAQISTRQSIVCCRCAGHEKHVRSSCCPATDGRMISVATAHPFRTQRSLYPVQTHTSFTASKSH